MNDDNHDMETCILICMLVDRQHNNRHATSQAGTLWTGTNGSSFECRLLSMQGSFYYLSFVWVHALNQY